MIPHVEIMEQGFGYIPLSPNRLLHSKMILVKGRSSISSLAISDGCGLKQLIQNTGTSVGRLLQESVSLIGQITRLSFTATAVSLRLIPSAADTDAGFRHSMRSFES
uniref:Uncharacterized protein n=1 Tax=Spongospora subterranea TaxID=70186 RepID=A0A0H5QFV9_9EUKA|eukprot:CRZ00820.1 hypothetical protein [Spongospora subterranea]